MTRREIPRVPPLKDSELRGFLEAAKERIEIITGRRGSPIDPAADTGERWQDLLSEITTRTTGAGTPAYNVLVAPNRSYQFAVNDEVYNSLHVPHDWKPGTPVYLHIHWIGTNTNTGTVTWDFNWTYAKGYGQKAFSANSLLQVTQAHCGIANGHNIAELSASQALLPDGFEPDGLLKVATKLSAKTYTGNVFADYIDLHYQSDEILTTTKNPVSGAWIKNLSARGDNLVDKVNELLRLLQA